METFDVVAETVVAETVVAETVVAGAAEVAVAALPENSGESDCWLSRIAPKMRGALGHSQRRA